MNNTVIGRSKEASKYRQAEAGRKSLRAVLDRRSCTDIIQHCAEHKDQDSFQVAQSDNSPDLSPQYAVLYLTTSNDSDTLAEVSWLGLLLNIGFKRCWNGVAKKASLWSGMARRRAQGRGTP